MNDSQLKPCPFCGGAAQLTQAPFNLRKGYEPGDGSTDGEQIINGEWWRPRFGCESLDAVLEALSEKKKMNNPHPSDALAAAKRIQKMTNSEMRLYFGEMTAAEIRLVRSIIDVIVAPVAVKNERYAKNI